MWSKVTYFADLNEVSVRLICIGNDKSWRKTSSNLLNCVQISGTEGTLGQMATINAKKRQIYWVVMMPLMRKMFRKLKSKSKKRIINKAKRGNAQRVIAIFSQMMCFQSSNQRTWHKRCVRKWARWWAHSLCSADITDICHHLISLSPNCIHKSGEIFVSRFVHRKHWKIEREKHPPEKAIARRKYSKMFWSVLWIRATHKIKENQTVP